MNRRDFLKTAGIGLLSFNFPFITRAESVREIYLTIDDGPRDSMEATLQSLGDDKATFFVVGELLEDEERFKLACRALESGHEIGNHSYSHPNFRNISLNKAKMEIEKTEKLIEKVYGEVGKPHKKLFRYPYGDTSERVTSFLKENGYSEYLWDVDTNDWKHYSSSGRSINAILHTLETANDGDVVLVHDYPILHEFLIPYLQEKGYKSKVL